jgi:hypothetical protein
MPEPHGAALAKPAAMSWDYDHRPGDHEILRCRGRPNIEQTCEQVMLWEALFTYISPGITRVSPIGIVHSALDRYARLIGPVTLSISF